MMGKRSEPTRREQLSQVLTGGVEKGDFRHNIEMYKKFDVSKTYQICSYVLQADVCHSVHDRSGFQEAASSGTVAIAGC